MHHPDDTNDYPSSNHNHHHNHHENHHHSNQKGGGGMIWKDVLRLSASSVLQGDVPSVLRPRRLHLTTTNNTNNNVSSTTTANTSTTSTRRTIIEQRDASDFAKQSSLAGYLDKLGKNIVEYKRRFFVLAPATHLYYFVSPSDRVPWGCMDLGGATIAVSSTDIDITTPTGGIIQLRAKTPAMAQQWATRMQEERLSYQKIEYQNSQHQVETLETKINNLEQTIEHYKLVERDRDGAIQDANEWRDKYERLEKALHLLTQQLRRPPPPTPNTTINTNTSTNTHESSSSSSDLSSSSCLEWLGMMDQESSSLLLNTEYVINAIAIVDTGLSKIVSCGTIGIERSGDGCGRFIHGQS